MGELKIDKNLAPYDIENKVESFHWWFVVRRKLLKSILSSISVSRNCLAIDIGCGTGSNLKTLVSEGFNAIGLDQSVYALNLVRKKGKFLVLAGDLNNLPLKTKSFGLIIAADIFEHLEDDMPGIIESYRILRKEGILILTVPAFKSLRGIQDKVTSHKRRYSKKEIVDKLKVQGFDILRTSYFNFFLFFPILIGRRLIQLFGLKIESENKVNTPLINFFLKTIFSLELYMLNYFPFPFGISIFCVAKKKGEC